MVDISVWITTYNHERFIAEAIESVLMQQTTFTYELVIGEDCSTDRTREIVRAYAARYPDKIRLFLPPANLGMIPMTWASYRHCTGRYVAWLDGDDYWLDPHKLQKQVSFLEENAEFFFCFHRVKIQIDTRSLLGPEPASRSADNTLTLKDFIQIHNPVHALSVVHRRVPPEELPAWVLEVPFPDFGLHIVFCAHGKAKYLSEVMGLYRIHSEGAYAGQSAYVNFAKFKTFFEVLKKTQGPEYVSFIDKTIRHYRYAMLRHQVMNTKAVQVLQALRRRLASLR